MFDRNQPLWLYLIGLFLGVGGILQKDQILPLTSLRFFAAGAIVIFHISGQKLIPFGPMPALATGVSLFFVLSGFILTYNYQGRKASVAEFYLSRFARLWPVHAATMLVAMFILPQLGTWATRESGTPIFLSNILLLQAWIPNSAYTLSFNGVAWSISVEMFFYAVFPLALIARRLWLFAVACLAATLMIIVYAELSSIPAKAGSWDYSWKHVVLHLPPMRLFEFLTGMATARIFLARGSFSKDTTLLEVSAIGLAIGSVILAQRFASPGPLGTWISQCGSFFAFAILVYVLAAGQGKVVAAMNNPILVRLGEISFATYMVHQIVIRHAIQSKLTAIWAKPIAALAIVVAAYLLSYVVWRMVEVPARRIILSLVRARQTAPAE